MAGDAAAVPAQQRLGCHHPLFAQGAGEGFGDGAEQGSVVIGEGRPFNLASEYLNLVPEHDDLEVLGASRTDGESGECGQEAVKDAKHEALSWRHRTWSAPTPEFPAPTG
jgi:hypothetical protein